MSTTPRQLAFKYRSGDASTLDRDLKSLRDAFFYSPPRSSLNDPFEGRFDRKSLDGQLAGFRKAALLIAPGVAPSLDAVANAANEFLNFVDKSGVFSLSYNPLNELIWAHYGGAHHGFCIGYDLERLVEFDPPLHWRLDVHYQDEAPALSSLDLLSSSPVAGLQKILGVKSTPWRYEEEVRIISTPPGKHEHDYRSVRKVYFGLRCPGSTRTAVMEVLAGRQVSFEQVVSDEPSYRLTSIAIPDEFASAPRFKQNIAPIADGAIYTNHLRPEQKKHEAYLHKAAEIVRREPYCAQVEALDFSPSASTPDRAVIYVHYTRAPGKWMKRLFSLDEIDRQYAELELNQ